MTTDKNNPINVTMDSQGSTRVIVGTDSDFEGATTVFYDSIELTLMESE